MRDIQNYNLLEGDFKDIDTLLRRMVDKRHGKDAPLAYGVGNNMSYSFYVRDSSTQVRFYPDGIKGSMITFSECEKGDFGFVKKKGVTDEIHEGI